jgi:hypothetical protein
MIVYEKNSDEVFQNSVYHSANGDVSRGKKDKNTMLPVSKGDVQGDANQGV